MSYLSIILVIVLCFSIILNFLFFVLDIFPLFHHKKFKRLIDNSISDNEYVEAVIEGAFTMAKSQKGYFFSRVESNNIVERVRSLLKHNSRSSFSMYNYHRAFLFGGLLSILIKRGDDRFLYAKTLFDKYLNKKGLPSFVVNQTDQAVFGLVAIELFEYTKEEKYKNFAEVLLDYLNENKNEKNIIQYRKGNSQLVDVIGFIIPFLIKYGSTFNNQLALTLAYDNINYYIQHGIDERTRIPYHAVNIHSNIKLGPTNWGRGIGWYILGLYYILKYTDNNNNPFYKEHESEYKGLKEILEKEYTDNLWPQFLGQSGSTDSSASLLFLYSCVKDSEKEKTKIIHSLKTLTSTKGLIDFTSGETIGVNRYSSTFSYSELSQGILLYYLSEK